MDSDDKFWLWLVGMCLAFILCGYTLDVYKETHACPPCQCQEKVDNPSKE